MHKCNLCDYVCDKKGTLYVHRTRKHQFNTRKYEKIEETTEDTVNELKKQVKTLSKQIERINLKNQQTINLDQSTTNHITNNLNILMTKDDLKDFSDFWQTLESRIEKKVRAKTFLDETFIASLARHFFRSENDEPYVAISDASRNTLISQINGKSHIHKLENFHPAAQILADNMLEWMYNFYIERKLSGANRSEFEEGQTSDIPKRHMNNVFSLDNTQSIQTFHKYVHQFVPKLGCPKRPSLLIDFQKNDTPQNPTIETIKKDDKLKALFDGSYGKYNEWLSRQLSDFDPNLTLCLEIKNSTDVLYDRELIVKCSQNSNFQQILLWSKKKEEMICLVNNKIQKFEKKDYFKLLDQIFFKHKDFEIDKFNGHTILHNNRQFVQNKFYDTTVRHLRENSHSQKIIWEKYL